MHRAGVIVGVASVVACAGNAWGSSGLWEVRAETWAYESGTKEVHHVANGSTILGVESAANNGFSEARVHTGMGYAYMNASAFGGEVSGVTFATAHAEVEWLDTFLFDPPGTTPGQVIDITYSMRFLATPTTSYTASEPGQYGAALAYSEVHVGVLGYSNTFLYGSSANYPEPPPHVNAPNIDGFTRTTSITVGTTYAFTLLAWVSVFANGSSPGNFVTSSAGAEMTLGANELDTPVWGMSWGGITSSQYADLGIISASGTNWALPLPAPGGVAGFAMLAAARMRRSRR